VHPVRRFDFVVFVVFVVFVEYAEGVPVVRRFVFFIVVFVLLQCRPDIERRQHYEDVGLQKRDEKFDKVNEQGK
jgi:hypothetical protein